MDFSAKNVGQLEKRKKRKTKIRARKYLQQTDGLRLVERGRALRWCMGIR